MTAVSPHRTSVLAVGLERYDWGADLDLPGAADHAVNFAQWAARQGVPPGRIRLACSWLEASAVKPLRGATLVGTTRDDLDVALHKLMHEGGDLLALYWCGHGVTDQGTNRALFTSNAVPDAKRNLPLGEIQRLLTSDKGVGFAQVVVVVDACANFLEQLNAERSLPKFDFGELTAREVPLFLYLSTDLGQIAEFDPGLRRSSFSTYVIDWLNEHAGAGLPPDLSRLRHDVDVAFKKRALAGDFRQWPVSVVVGSGGSEERVNYSHKRQLTNLPRRPSECFVGRLEELKRLNDLLAAGTKTDVGSRAAVAVVGSAGVGKSELALHYAGSRVRDGAVVWWIPAETSESAALALSHLILSLNPSIQGVWTTTAAAAESMKWLSENTGWLVILDNVEDPRIIEPLLGRLTNGDVLVTTRRDLTWRRWGLTPLDVYPLSCADSVDLLRKIIGGDRPNSGTADHEFSAKSELFDEDAASELAEELSCLPLALQQAAAYIAQQHLSISRYLDRLLASPARTLALVAEGDDPARAVAQTWQVTLATLSKSHSAAVEILRALAWVAPDELPREVITHLGPVDELLGVLASYSLITLTATTVSIHRVLQLILGSEEQLHDGSAGGGSADAKREGRLTQGQAMALTWLDSATLEGTQNILESWPRWELVVPHVLALNQSWPREQPSLTLARILTDMGSFLLLQGQMDEALNMKERSYMMTVQLLGPGHVITGTRLDNVASALRALGRHRESLPKRQEALAIVEASRGSVHVETGVRLNNLAGTLHELGRFAEALPVRERSLAIAENVLGGGHLTTAQRLSGLAFTWQALGRYKRALPLQQRALEITEKELGRNHPTTGLRLDDLGVSLLHLGYVDLAHQKQERAVTIAREVLRPGHPDLGARLDHLAATMHARGQDDDGLALRREALGVTQAALGLGHPDTAMRLDNLAESLQIVGDYGNALPLRERALDVTETALGPDHPVTGLRLQHLATTLRTMGRIQQAAVLQERALIVLGASLGPEHPWTRMART